MRSKVFKKMMCGILSAVMVAGLVSGQAVTNTTYAAKKAKVTKKSVNLVAGSKKTIRIKNKNKKCKYTFKTSNKKIAKVSSKGVVTGVKEGKTKVTVKEVVKKTKKAKKLATVKVTVRKKVTVTANNPGNNVSIPTAVAGGNVVSTPSTDATPSPTPVSTPCVDFDFSNGDISMFQPEGENVKISISNDGYDDDSCIKATGRTKNTTWWDFGCGMAINLSKYVQSGKTYSLKCYVKCDTPATFTVRSKANNGGFSFPTQIGNELKVNAKEWTEFEAVFASPDILSNNYIIYWDASTAADIYLDSLVIQEKTVLDSTFKDTFTSLFGNVGTCNRYDQLKNNKLFTTTLYNSITMENETKPSSLLNAGNVSNNVPQGYIIPDSYKDGRYPVIQFDTLDQVINTAYEYGLKIRFHVLVWHSQTPEFFFKKNFNDDAGYVSKDYMEGRLEYYVKNIIKHIYELPHGKDVVYCIDVANEYFHNYDKGSKPAWNSIYYPAEKSESDRTNKPEYVKNAFKYAYEMLEQFGLAGTVKLFYNDYNTYEVTDNIIEMINYINEDGKVCDGVGMQSHLDVDYPTPGMTGKIAATIDAFTKQGFEIQITELDVTDYDNSGKQEAYYCELIKMLIEKKKSGSNITGITFWGLCDNESWRRDGKPLLFSSIFAPKPVFYKVIEAAKSAMN